MFIQAPAEQVVAAKEEFSQGKGKRERKKEREISSFVWLESRKTIDTSEPNHDQTGRGAGGAAAAAEAAHLSSKRQEAARKLASQTSALQGHHQAREPSRRPPSERNCDQRLSLQQSRSRGGGSGSYLRKKCQCDSQRAADERPPLGAGKERQFGPAAGR